MRIALTHIVTIGLACAQAPPQGGSQRKKLSYGENLPAERPGSSPVPKEKEAPKAPTTAPRPKAQLSYGRKDCTVKEGRKIGDLCAYYLCGEENRKKNLAPAEELKTVDALIEQIQKDTKIDLEACEDEELIDYLKKNLTELDLSDKGISDLGPISQLTAIEKLYVANNSLPASGLDTVSSLINLKVLDISNTDSDHGDNRVRELGYLAPLSKLQKLHAGYNDIQDLAPLIELPLKSVDLRYNRVSSFLPLKGKKGITVLTLGNVDAIESQVPLIGSDYCTVQESQCSCQGSKVNVDTALCSTTGVFTSSSDVFDQLHSEFEFD